MTEYYKGERIAELLETIAKAESVFESVDTRSLDDKMFRKLAYAKALVCINKAKLTALQGESDGKSI